MKDMDSGDQVGVAIALMIFVFVMASLAAITVSSQLGAERRATLQVACIQYGGNWNDIRSECVI